MVAAWTYLSVLYNDSGTKATRPASMAIEWKPDDGRRKHGKILTKNIDLQ